MKEDTTIYAFVIIVFKMASRSPYFGGKKWHPLFFTKSWSKNNFKPKNQFQQANPTGAQNLTLWPLLIIATTEPKWWFLSSGRPTWYRTRS